MAPHKTLHYRFTPRTFLELSQAVGIRDRVRVRGIVNYVSTVFSELTEAVLRYQLSSWIGTSLQALYLR